MSFEYNICRASFAGLSNFKMHLKVLSGGRPYKCDICSSSFAQFSNLKKYCLISAASLTQLFRSRIWSFVFSRSHLNVVGQPPFHSVCILETYQDKQLEKAFQNVSFFVALIQSGMLNQHQRIHSGEKPFNIFIFLLNFCQHLINYFSKKSKKSAVINSHSNSIYINIRFITVVRSHFNVISLLYFPQKFI